jgi:hypothetical protein
MQTNRMKVYFAGFIGFVGLLVVALGFTFSASAAEDDAYVRVVHASPSAPAVDVYVNGTVVLTNVEFFTPSSYLPVDASSGDVQIQVTVAGDPPADAVISRTVAISPGNAYTVAAVDLSDFDGGPGLDTNPLFVEDDVSVPSEGLARVNVYHLAPDAGVVDLLVNGDPLTRGLTLSDTVSAIVPSGSYTLTITPTMGVGSIGVTSTPTDTLPYTIEVDLEDQQVYSAFAVGRLADTDFRVELTEELAQVRVVHASPSAPAVDVYLDGTAVLTDVEYFAVSDYLQGILVGDRLIQVTPAGDSLENSVISTTATLTPTAYTVAAVDTVPAPAAVSSQPVVVVDDLSEPPEGQARIQAYHFVADAPAPVSIRVVDGPTLFSDLEFRDRAQQEVDAGTYSLEAFANVGGQDVSLVTDENNTFRAGAIYSAFAIGTADTGDEAPIEVRIIPGTKMVYLPFISTPSTE